MDPGDTHRRYVVPATMVVWADSPVEALHIAANVAREVSDHDGFDRMGLDDLIADGPPRPEADDDDDA